MLNLPRRHFLPWDRPLLPQAVAFLAGDWAGPDPLDLTANLVIVPTRQSGRRLREALAVYAAARGSAVFPPRVLTPEALLAEAEEADSASRLQLTLAWIAVLRAIELDAFREVFPVDPPSRNFAWALRLAQQFVRLQAALAENQLAFADVLVRTSGDFPDAGRWRQLGELEQRVVARLAQAGLQTPGKTRQREGALRGCLAGFNRVILVGTVDPLAAAITLLGAETHVGIDVLVFAPATQADRFDGWGRPLLSSWTSGVIDLPDFERRVHLCADASDQAARLADLGREYLGNSSGSNARTKAATTIDGRLGIGMADPEVAALFAGEAARAGVPVFDPEGRRRAEGALYHLLSALGDGMTRPTFADVEALARCPEVLAYLADRFGGRFSAARLLEALDTLRRHHLPSDLREARQHASAEVAPWLEALDSLHQTLAQQPFPENAATVLAEIFRARRLDPADKEDAALQDAAAAWTSVLRDCAAAAQRFTELADNEWRELALQLFGESRRTEDKPEGAIELQGWLELLFEDAPHLVVAGLNDGFVPEAVTEDVFLPESLRVRLGLKTNAARLARDAYLLEALAASRRDGGRLDLLFGKTSAAGDPLRPSRLLLRCPDAALPERVDFLFRAPDPAESHLPWIRAWQLRPRQVGPLRQVAVTSLRRWLACPFRFYLKYALRMEAIDPAKTEMDAFDFGTLCHAALEAMGRDAAMRDCTDGTVLREFLLRELERNAQAKFGAALTLPLLIQVESARQRLGKFAEVQARARVEGWVIQAVEQPFSVEIGGLVVKGKIDRIDQHATTGAVRVLDYKTSDSGVVPRAAHVRAIRHDEVLPDWAAVEIEGKRRAWADLQLPLYRHALAGTWGSAISLGYVTLPKAVTETVIAVWDDYSLELHEAAMRCAEGVCSSIARGEFWPPNEDIKSDHDEFATLFHHGVSESVTWHSQEKE